MGLLSWLNGSNAPSNKKLMACMDALSEGESLQAREELYREMLSAVFLVPTSTAPEREEMRVTEEAESIEATFYKTDRGGIGMAIFTDLESLRAASPESQGYIALESELVFKMALQNEIEQLMINPAGPLAGGFLTQYEFEKLSRGEIPIGPSEICAETIGVGTALRIGLPETPFPRALGQQISQALAEFAEISSAYILLQQVGDSEPELCLTLVHAEPLTASQLEASAQKVGDALSNLPNLPISPLAFRFSTMEQSPYLAEYEPLFVRAVA